jgi:predicted RecB family nuclease
MVINSAVFEAFLKCPRKSRLRSLGELENGNDYANWLRTENESYRESGIRDLLAGIAQSDCLIGPPDAETLRTSDYRFAVNVHIQTQGLEAHLHVVERIAAEGRSKPPQFIPIRFAVTNKLTKDDKLLLAFDALVLAEALRCDVIAGKIIHGDTNAVLRVKLLPLINEARKQILRIPAASSPVDLVLNRHCGECEYQARCRTQAKEKEELSLLGGLSGNKRKKLHERGIFTITQLSHTFRPRRRSRGMHGRREKYHHSLRALAIRENRIHAVDLSELKFDGTPVYLDVEGLPDRNFFYLIGVRVRTREGAIQHSFWANDEGDERRIWKEILALLARTPNPHIISYGGYETAFLKRMRERYGGPHKGTGATAAILKATNLLSHIYARIYFPTFSNSLKDVAGYLGFRWSGRIRSGLGAIVTRHRWEASGDDAYKHALIDYNQQDCEALELVTNRLVGLQRPTAGSDSSSQGEVVRISDIKSGDPYQFKRNEFVFPEMEDVNKAAYWHYQRDRVYVKSRNMKRTLGRKRYPLSVPVPNTSIEYPRPSRCQMCKSNLIYGHGKRTRIVLDLKFMRFGVKRWIVRYVCQRYRCLSCRRTFYASHPRWPPKYGSSLVAYAIYQNIELRLPQGRVAASVNQLFGLSIRRSRVHRFKTAAAKFYQSTYHRILKGLCKGHLLHVDETSAKVKGETGYVWALSSMQEVAYFYTQTREGSTIQAMLKHFSGVLVTDFYAAYDAISCPQQKCLIHLIRDFNEDLLKHPYDDSLKRVIGDFAGVIRPIVETIDHHGLKARFLGKHRLAVDRFYECLRADIISSEAAKKVADRLKKYRGTLFTFLDYDDVPWNNNNAEHAIKAFARHRQVFEGTTTEKGIHEYLVLLSICETCKYKNISFLDFLRSGLRDIDDFIKRKTRATEIKPRAKPGRTPALPIGNKYADRNPAK